MTDKRRFGRLTKMRCTVKDCCGCIREKATRDGGKLLTCERCGKETIELAKDPGPNNDLDGPLMW